MPRTPVVLVIVLNYLLATWLLPALDTSYLSEPRFGATRIESVRGIWAVIVALAGFALLRDVVLGIAPDNPLVSLSIAVNLLAGITGSATGTPTQTSSWWL